MDLEIIYLLVLKKAIFLLESDLHIQAGKTCRILVAFPVAFPQIREIFPWLFGGLPVAFWWPSRGLSVAFPWPFGGLPANAGRLPAYTGRLPAFAGRPSRWYGMRAPAKLNERGPVSAPPLGKTKNRPTKFAKIPESADFLKKEVLWLTGYFPRFYSDLGDVFSFTRAI